MAITDYKPGHVKRDPVTGAVALRTAFPDEGPLAAQAWLTATKNIGAHAKRTDEVKDWDDLFTP
jgi:hypothetical protein